MKKLFLLMFCLNSANVYSESVVLPPVIDNSNYSGTNGSSFGAAAPSANAMYEVLSRLEQLQLEVQQLRGVVDEQSQTIVDLKKRQRNIYSDLDLRLQELSGVDIQSLARPKISLSNVTQKENAAVSSLTSEVNAVKVVLTVKEAPKVIITAEELKNNQKARYTEAYNILRNGHNSRAISAFKALLKEFPNGEYADNSQYWLAEAFKVNQNLVSAKNAFSKVVSQYPNSPKVPDALLKLGYIEFDANNLAKARDYLTQVTVGHPGTTAAHLASKKLMKMGVIQP